VLNNTGVSGGLTVTGTGSAGSGGTIQNATGSGIALTSTQNVNLAYLNIQSGDSDGINGSSVNGITLNTVATINNGSSKVVAADKGIELVDPAGALSFTNVTATGNYHHNILIDDTNNTGGTSSLSITGGTIGNHPLPAADINNNATTGMLVTIRGTATLGTSTISGVIFENNRVLGLQVTGGDTANISDLTVSGNTFRDTGTGNSQEISVDFAKAQTSSMMLNNTTIMNHNSHAMNFFTGADVVNPPAGTYNARITGNVIGNLATIDSGSRIGNGMRLNVNGGTDARILANTNTLHQIPTGRGIEAIARNGTGGGDFTINSNTITAPTATAQIGCGVGVLCPLAPIFVQSNAVSVANNACSAVSGNTAYDPLSVPGGAGGEFSIQLAESNLSTHTYEGNTGLTAQVNLNNANPLAVTRFAAAGVGVVAVGTCITPP
jgi:mucin-19